MQDALLQDGFQWKALSIAKKHCDFRALAIWLKANECRFKIAKQHFNKLNSIIHTDLINCSIPKVKLVSYHVLTSEVHFQTLHIITVLQKYSFFRIALLLPYTADRNWSEKMISPSGHCKNSVWLSLLCFPNPNKRPLKNPKEPKNPKDSYADIYSLTLPLHRPILQGPKELQQTQLRQELQEMWWKETWWMPLMVMIHQRMPCHSPQCCMCREGSPSWRKVFPKCHQKWWPAEPTPCLAHIIKKKRTGKRVN